jgi:hypothetical protein
MSRNVPIIINTRDRLSPLLLLLDWLEQQQQTNIWLCDNASTYPPMVEFLSTTQHHVVRLEFNLGHRAPWLSGLVAELGFNTHFVVSDPDVVPTGECPGDLFELFATTLDQHPEIDKIGLSLKIDDLPDHYRHKHDVLTWEQQFWNSVYIPGFFKADVDTTFAVYRPGSGHQNGNSLRSVAPYSARHMPWYDDSSQSNAELEYYVQHADPLIINWDHITLPASLRAHLQKLRSQSAPSNRH